MKKSILLLLILLFGACSRYDYTLHKPVVKYKKPSSKALSYMLKETNHKRYRWAEEGPHSFDCSGFTYYSYGSMNLWLPRRAIEQSRYGKTVSIRNLRYGDLIFFDTRKYSRGKINHVGIYIGKNRFRHASSRKGRIITTSLSKPYYRNRVVICKRVIPSKRVCIKPKTRIKPKPKFKTKIEIEPKLETNATLLSYQEPIKAKSLNEIDDNISKPLGDRELF
jgi:hypothetical protein